LAASNKAGYTRLIDIALEYGKSKGGSLENQVNAATDRLASYSLQPWNYAILYDSVAGGIRQGNPPNHPWPSINRT
jgi:hypothetical protein